MTKQTPELVLINLVLFTVIFFLLRKSLKPGKRVSKANITFSKVCIFLFCIFAFYDTDYFHYREIMDLSFDDYAHLEDVYKYIIDFVDRNYTLFRTIVWGGALCIFIQTIKRLKIEQASALALFSFIIITKFAYARVSLGFAVLMFGIAYLTFNEKLS